MTIIDPKKPSPLRRFLPAGGLIAVGLVLGTFLGVAAVGGAPKAAEPQPAETITVTEEVLVDDGCREVAEELHSMLLSLNDDVVLPLSTAGSMSADAMLSVVQNLNNPAAWDVAGVERSTSMIQEANRVLETLTSRADALAPDYRACVG